MLERYAYAPFQLLRENIAPRDLNGLSVVELGPGDHAPLALLCLAAGARDYTVIDRFPGELSGPNATAVYEELLEDLSTREPQLARGFSARGLSGSNFVDSGKGLVRVIGQRIEEVSASVAADVVFSYNVLEHVTDVPELARRLWRMMMPGAVCIHRVNYSAHDAWTKRANPLEWLMLPDWLWRAMGSNRGTPNRLRHAEVLEAFEKAGFETRSTILKTYDDALVVQHKPHLAKRFREMPIQSLRVEAAVIQATKPS